MTSEFGIAVHAMVFLHHKGDMVDVYKRQGSGCVRASFSPLQKLSHTDQLSIFGTKAAVRARTSCGDVYKRQAHKVQLFTRMRHHIQVQRPRLRKFLFVISVHFLHDGCFAVDHLVVGKREKILFLRKVRHGKRQLVVLCLSLIHI